MKYRPKYKNTCLNKYYFKFALIKEREDMLLWKVALENFAGYVSSLEVVQKLIVQSLSLDQSVLGATYNVRNIQQNSQQLEQTHVFPFGLLDINLICDITASIFIF